MCNERSLDVSLKNNFILSPIYAKRRRFVTKMMVHCTKKKLGGKMRENKKHDGKMLPKKNITSFITGDINPKQHNVL